MSEIVTELAELLSQARRPGDFCTSGTTPLLPPALSVAGVGPIALPLLPVQAAQLVAVAEQAPYGRGPDTIVDTAMCNTWQIAPEHPQIGGRHWPQTLATILGMVGEGLGVSDNAGRRNCRRSAHHPPGVIARCHRAARPNRGVTCSCCGAVRRGDS